MIAMMELTLGTFRIAVASAGANAWTDEDGKRHYQAEVWATATRMREKGV